LVDDPHIIFLLGTFAMATTGPDATVTVPEITVRLSPGTITIPTSVSPSTSASPQHGMTAAEADAAADRNDFIKRLFAVVISVGFATTVPSTLQWIVTFSSPDRVVARSSALLLASLLLVVQSWEGYLASVRLYPLKDIMRFIFDIILVFEYLLLLNLSVDKGDLTHYKFFTCVCTIFFTYLAWDYFRVLAYRDRYSVKGPIDALVPLIRGLFVGSSSYKGPSITLWWFLYFIITYELSDFSGCVKFYSMALAIVYGLIMYRLDKLFRFGIIAKVTSLVIPIAILITIIHVCDLWTDVCDVPQC
jgi:hypothetical protein